MRLSRKHRIISAINLVSLVFNLLTPFFYAAKPVYAASKGEIEANGGSICEGKTCYAIDKEGKVKVKRRSMTDAEEAVATQKAKNAGVAPAPSQRPNVDQQEQVSRDQGSCKTVWCGGGGGFCADQAMYNQGLGCNAQAKKLFNEDPCYVAGTCQLAKNGCPEHTDVTPDGYCMTREVAEGANKKFDLKLTKKADGSWEYQGRSVMIVGEGDNQQKYIGF